MTKEEILQKHEDQNEYHFHQVDREWIMEAMQEYADQQLRLYGVVSSVPNKALKDSQLSDVVSGYKVMCKPDANFEKYYSKGFTECWEWIKRITK
jgi:hypothetical protein